MRIQWEFEKCSATKNLVQYLVADILCVYRYTAARRAYPSRWSGSSLDDPRNGNGFCSLVIVVVVYIYIVVCCLLFFMAREWRACDLPPWKKATFIRTMRGQSKCGRIVLEAVKWNGTASRWGGTAASRDMRYGGGGAIVKSFLGGHSWVMASNSSWSRRLLFGLLWERRRTGKDTTRHRRTAKKKKKYRAQNVSRSVCVSLRRMMSILH